MQSTKQYLADLLQHKQIIIFGILVCAVGVVALLPSVFVRAGDFDVSTCDPAELIIAIDSANTTPGADDIYLNGSCTYALTEINSNFAGNDSGLPLITTTVTIHGNGATIARSEAPGTPNFNFFGVKEVGQLDIRDLTLFNGIAFQGGAIQSRGILTVTNGNFISNTAKTVSGYELGGAILNFYGTVTINHSTFSQNRATDDGGAVANANGYMEINDSTFVNNSTSETGLNGGAIMNYLDAVMVLNDSTISNNTGGRGGGIYNHYSPSLGASSLTINNSTISFNHAYRETYGGGGIFIIQGI